MPTTCAECGAEFLGAVNRCWQCGKVFPSAYVTQAEPPVRREPPGALEAAPTAQIVTTAEVVDEGSPFRALAAEMVPHRAREVANESPLQTDGEADHPLKARPPVDRPPTAPLRKPGWRSLFSVDNAAVVSLCCGVIGVYGGFTESYLWAALVLNALGLALGVWGISSRRRKTSVTGLTLCCLGLLVSGFFVALSIYTASTGIDPRLQLPEWLQSPY